MRSARQVVGSTATLCCYRDTTEVAAWLRLLIDDDVNCRVVWSKKQTPRSSGISFRQTTNVQLITSIHLVRDM